MGFNKASAPVRHTKKWLMQSYSLVVPWWMNSMSQGRIPNHVHGNCAAKIIHQIIFKADIWSDH